MNLDQALDALADSRDAYSKAHFELCKGEYGTGRSFASLRGDYDAALTSFKAALNTVRDLEETEATA